jgi:hypothetical protein
MPPRGRTRLIPASPPRCGEDARRLDILVSQVPIAGRWAKVCEDRRRGSIPRIERPRVHQEPDESIDQRALTWLGVRNGRDGG